MSKPREQDDFDNAVNHQWKLDNPIPDKYPRYENFTILSEKMESIMVEICKGDTDTLVNKIFNLFIQIYILNTIWTNRYTYSERNRCTSILDIVHDFIS